MTLPDMRSVVPHEDGMVLLDRLVAADQESLCAEVAIGPHSLFYDGQGVGSWVGIEYMAQAIAAHAGCIALMRGEPVEVGFLLGSRRYQCSQPRFADGSVLQIHVQRVLQGDNGLGAFECHIVDTAGGATVATATVTVFQPENVSEFLQRSQQ